MIHTIKANHPSFRTVTLTPGLNVILADRTPGSSREDTRNGLGKSTLVEIIHFCLGASVRRGRGLAIPALSDWAFTIEVSLGGDRLSVTRALETPNEIRVASLSDTWPEVLPTNLYGRWTFNRKQWQALLGKALFSLPAHQLKKYNPSFRSLISYFVRRDRHAFGDPFSHFRIQKPWDRQLHVALLVGLEWHHAVQWQSIKDQESDLKDLRKLAKRGALPFNGNSIGQLEARHVTLSQELDERARALESFKVHPQYETIQQDADRLTDELHDATNANIVASRRLRLYQQAVTSEDPPSEESVEKVYKEMGVVFTENVRRSLAEAREFYSLVVKDRRRFLEKEISRLKDRISKTDGKIRELTETRGTILQILREHGALNEMTRLRERHAETSVSLERLKQQIVDRRKLESDRHRIARDKVDLADLAARDREERRDTWEVPVRLFNLNSRALYQAPGRLVIDTSDSGFRFNIEINKSGSKGIDSMKVFCFDLAILEFCASRGLSIDFLFHDSDLFDGVDSRQRALALERAQEVAERTGTQYICALNSDMVPHNDFSEDFEFENYVRHHLADGDASGTLLGIVFDAPTGP